MEILKKSLVIMLMSALAVACSSKKETQGQKEEKASFRTVGTIERLDPILDEIISPTAKIEVLAEGLGWSEGPVWLKEQKKLLFTDVGHKKIYSWTEEDSIQVYMDMVDPKDSTDRLGPSALLIDKNQNLIILRYGHGEAVKMNASITAPAFDFHTIARSFDGKPFNHTNDATFHSNGDMYMSDPPPPEMSDERLGPGFYRINPEGEVNLITDTIPSPNGIAFSPDERTVYIANADYQHAFWVIADVDEEGNISNGRKFFDATGRAPKEKGHPDGLKVNRNGIIFATGPGGVYILTPEGKHLGTILNDEFNTNCVLDDKEEVLYITSGPYLMRVIL
ncbi:SMP-30/gluconolactonase/LRE family protein [Fulvivirgaceae bacterium BMA10]|uniref:SMP-30/gluconolactonase/LRE family protein n=1 Tax=Splendidivirga corallicola TaxID=3051826 RepID=A0ABT8KPW1_9BACT|nr:SMP-30/gluconolactonase/LRE family protein [Fulvivirgaceae bacterium BMA10]